MSEEQAGAAIARAARTVSAPQSLRERLAAPAPRRRRPRRPAPARLALGGAAAALLAAAVLLVTSGGPTIQEVAAASLRAPTRPASERSERWGARGWDAVGERVDIVAGRRAVTWIYRRGDRGVHYAVLEGPPLAISGGRDVRVYGRRYKVLRDGPTAIVTWESDGRTCLLASRLVGEDELLAFLGS